MKYKQLTKHEIAGIISQAKAMPSASRQSVPTCMRIYGEFIPAIKALRKMGYRNNAIAALLFLHSRGRVGPTYGNGNFNIAAATAYVSTVANYKG